MKSPVSWVGGKSHVASRIVAMMPPHDHYVEVFGGGLSVFFMKPKSRLETVNDKSKELMNFWLVCRDRAEELVAKLESTPYSRALFDEWKAKPLPDDPVERAAWWFFLQCSRFSGNYHGGWSYCRMKSTVSVPPAARFRRRISRILVVRDRFAEVQIECADFRVMFERYSGCPDNLLFCDPPYFGTEYYYREKFTEQDHRDLAALIAGSRAKIILSYYNHPLLDELYPDLCRREIRTVKHGAKSLANQKKPKGCEIVLMNYELESDLLGVSDAKTLDG